MIIAIKGYIGSGKSYISNILKNSYEFKVIEADQIIRTLYEDTNIQKQITEILNLKRFDKKEIANKVFKDPEELKKLENFIHPKLENEINKVINNNIDSDIIIDCQVIDKLNININYEILTKCSKKELIKRVQERDNRSQEEIINIINIQETFKIQTNKIFPINTELGEEQVLKNLKKIITIFRKDMNKEYYEDEDDFYR